MTVFAVGVLLGGFWVGGHAASAGAERGEGRGWQGLETVVVGADDTLWEIAEESRPEADPRVTVQRILDLNGLSTVVVQPGQSLKLPSR